MKITLLHYRYAPSIAGVERVMEAHARLLVEAGHEVTVLCGAGESRDTRVQVVIFSWLLEGGGESDPERFAVEVDRASAELRPWLAGADRVFVHNVLTMPFQLACTAALWRLAGELPAGRLVNWVHDLAALNPDYPRAANEPNTPWALLRQSHPAIRAVAISDHRAKQFLQLTGAPVDLVIPNGVDPGAILNLTPPVARLAQDQRLWEADALLLQPARILRRKNLHLGLHLIAALKARGYQARLLITGARDEHNGASAEVRGELLALRASLGLENEVLIVSEFFAVTNDDLASLYSLCDVLWFPSREEGFGLPLLEAAIHRLLLFCADSAPMNTMALSNARFFDPSGVPDAIADQFLHFLGENRLFLEARRDVVRRFAWEAIWPRIEAFLRPASFCPFDEPPCIELTSINSTHMNRPVLDEGNLNSLLAASHGDPFAVLGLHATESGCVVRVLRPDASAVTVEALDGSKRRVEATRAHDAGFFEAHFEGDGERFEYQLHLTPYEGEPRVERDPYSYAPFIGPIDLHLYAEGHHWQIYEKLGAHLKEVGGVRGCFFAVWAPNAQRVSVVGDWNRWDGRVHAMRKHPGTGIWEIFIPGVGEGAHYKFEIKGCQGNVFLKSDPYAFYSQHGLQTAAIVFDLHQYRWSDSTWMESRKNRPWHKSPVSIYEVHLGSWARVPEDGDRFLSYLEFADRLLNYVCEMGYTHIELMPVAEHPFDGSWGYQVTGYFAPTSRFGNPDEFRYFVDKCHRRGIGVILDWVPGHFPKDAHGLAEFDGTDLYEHADPRQGEHADWGTLIFNYGRNEVRNFLIANALFWLEQYHIDGLRVDAVASMLYLDYSRKHGEWIPNCFGGRENLEAIHFLKQFNEVCYDRFPGIMTIAEESTAWPGVSRPTYLGGLGFGFKWNMGWMHDFLVYMAKEPVHRRFHQGDVTFSLLYAFHEHFMLVLSHDEVVHGKRSLIDKMPGDIVCQKFANLRMFYAWMYAHPGKKLLFQGGEFGQWEEWNHQKSLDWHLLQEPEHDGLRRLVQHLNWVYKNESSLWSLDESYEGFEWIDFHDADNSVVAFLRRGIDGSSIVFVINATPVVREGYRVGVPAGGWYEEIINTDAQTYGGSNIGNYGGQHAAELGWQGRSHSLLLRLPPLAVVGFKHQPSLATMPETTSAGESHAGV